MKIIVKSILILISTGASVYGQRGAFLSLSASGGVGGNLKESYNVNYSGSSIGVFGLDLKAGYRLGNNLELSTGIGITKTGISNKMEAVYPYNASPFSERFIYYNIYVPVEIGYSFKLSERFKLIPAISAGFSHLLSGKYFVETEQSYRQDLNRTTIRKNYNTVAFWAGAALSASYSFNERFSLFGGYRFNGMLKKFTKSSFAPNGDQQQLFVVNGELGIRCNF